MGRITFSLSETKDKDIIDALEEAKQRYDLSTIIRESLRNYFGLSSILKPQPKSEDGRLKKLFNSLE